MAAGGLERLEYIGNWLRNGQIDIRYLITALQEIDHIAMNAQRNSEGED